MWWCVCVCVCVCVVCAGKLELHTRAQRTTQHTSGTVRKDKQVIRLKKGPAQRSWCINCVEVCQLCRLSCRGDRGRIYSLRHSVARWALYSITQPTLQGCFLSHLSMRRGGWAVHLRDWTLVLRACPWHRAALQAAPKPRQCIRRRVGFLAHVSVWPLRGQ